jgi:hypothetical protein
MLTVRVASQDDLVDELGKGTPVEQYKAPEQPEIEGLEAN